MFKVHLPATSYFKKQVPFFGTNHFLKALRSPIKKSAMLTFTGRGGQEAHGWAPTDEGIHADPETHDHPPWSHDPEGNLVGGGNHPIDFVHKELMKDFGLDDTGARHVLGQAIERYNSKHEDDSNHHLPNFDSAQWRKVFVGPHYKNNVPTHLRETRASEPNHEGGPTPLITYATNQGNLPNGATGQWIDSGFIHMNREIGEVLGGYGVPPERLRGLNYVNHPALLPGSLSGGLVQSIGKTDWNKYQETGALPDRYLSTEEQESMAEQRMHPEVHAHQIPKLLGDPFFYPASSKTSAGGLTGEQLGQNLGQINHGLNEEELNDIASTRAMRLMFQNTHNINSDSGQGAVKNLLRLQLNELGSHHDDENYSMHLSNAKNAPMDEKTEFHGRANLLSRKVVAHLSNAAHKRMMDGMSEEDAIADVVQTMRNSEVDTKSRFAHKEGLREKTEAVIDAMLGATGHENFSLGTIPTDKETQHVTSSAPEAGHHVIPEHWQHRMVLPNEVAPVGNSIRDPSDTPQMRPAPSTVPSEPSQPSRPSYGQVPSAPRLDELSARPAPNLPPQRQGASDLSGLQRVGQPVGLAPNRQASPAETAFQQQRGLPQAQTFFDLEGDRPQLVQTSHDVVSGIDMIRKKMGYFDGFLRGES
tara:strand:- start:657 stop:2591 length:1935 start_codon:yes stop_codon:yes gene_type:complete